MFSSSNYSLPLSPQVESVLDNVGLELTRWGPHSLSPAGASRMREKLVARSLLGDFLELYEMLDELD